MSETPAAHLARLKVTFQSWVIRDVPRGESGRRRLQAVKGQRMLVASTPAELENLLADAEPRRGGPR